MNIADLRVALFSGNYNYVRDGANQALNRLADFLLRNGAKVRVYGPVVENPDFEPTGDLVPVPSMPIPFRSEYQLPLALSARVRRDLAAFAPNVVHVTSPDPVGHRAVTWGRKHNVPVLASVHTRFETYPRYYHMAFLEPLAIVIMRRFYRRCDAMVVPSESTAAVMREQRMAFDVTIWSRGVDREIFGPERRDLAWRRTLGIGDDELTIGYLGRLVVEKGLDVFADTMTLLRERNVPHRVLVVGEGPARAWFAERVPEACFTGLLTHDELGRAVASMDMLLNPSVTETFGNVTLEAMASRLPVIAANATGSISLVSDGVTGRLVEPGNVEAFADAIEAYLSDPALREKHGAAGEARSRDFSWDAINRVVADTYMRIIEARRR